VNTAFVSNGKDLPDNGNSNKDRGNNGDIDNQAINLPNTATADDNDNDDDDDEGVPRKTLVTATIRRKTDAANADIPEGGALNGPMTKLRQNSSLTFKALAPPRSGCS
jgi:hypothetical protein